MVEALDAAPVSLVAWSFAGHVALHAALAAPALFDAMLIYEPGVPTYVDDPADLAAWQEDAQLMLAPVTEALGRGDEAGAVRALIDGSGGPGCFDGQPEERRRIHLDSAHVLPRLFAAEPPTPIGPAELARLELPVAIAWGSASRPLFTIPSRAAARAIATGGHREIEGAGHLWPEAEPGAFSAFVAEWMESRRA